MGKLLFECSSDMDQSPITIAGIVISPEYSYDKFVENISAIVNILNIQTDCDLSFINELKTLCLCVLNKSKSLKDSLSCDAFEQLIKFHDITKRKLLACCSFKTEVRLEAFKSLFELLPLQVALRKKELFPNHDLGEIFKAIISSEADISIYLPFIQDMLNFEDISKNIWKALDIACCKLSVKLSPEEVSNILQIVNCTEKPSNKKAELIGPTAYYCLVPGGVLSDKDIGNCIKRFWDKMISVDLPPKTMQSLLLTLHERLMPRMNKPMFLTDFLMTCLETEGPISLLALQGIFTLIQKYNMNYPDVYQKIYSMLNPSIFGTQYKARFYYLMDMFLSSSHLPEALVAGFVKKFARLSLVAPPTDILIMLTFIINLMVRHPGLKNLIHNPSEITYKSDPYNIEEPDPSQSCALESSLWEIEILRNHVLPSVSSAANFINNPIPNVEKDISDLLESTTQEVFMKEYKMKLKNPPVSFEKPTSLFVPNVKSGFSLWNLC